MAQVRCAACKAELRLQPARVRRSRAQYCSIQCRRSTLQPVRVQCGTCKTDLLRYPYRLRRTPNQYCSPVCRVEAQRAAVRIKERRLASGLCYRCERQSVAGTMTCSGHRAEALISGQASRTGAHPSAVRAMIAKKPKACETCGREVRLALDHDHARPGILRGWLCASCNRALGIVKDSPDRLIALANYVRRSRLQEAS